MSPNFANDDMMWLKCYPQRPKLEYVSPKQCYRIMTYRDSIWHPELPRDQLPALPPTRELESRVVLKACIEPVRRWPS
jgi:hypothetical protein